MAGRTWLKDLKNDFERDMVRALKPLGHAALVHAYKEGHTDAPRIRLKGIRVPTLKAGSSSDGKWRHRTGNLHDSFASAVFVGGVLVQSSVQYLGGTISKKRDRETNKSGRQTVRDYLQRISFGKKNDEIILVVVAAMWYTYWLERGVLTDKFVVISPAREFIQKNWQRYVEPIYRKYGIKEKPKARVIKGERVKGLNFKNGQI